MFPFFVIDYSVLEQIKIKGPYLDQRLPQHESLYLLGLSAKIKSYAMGTFLLSKMSLNVIIVKLFSH